MAPEIVVCDSAEDVARRAADLFVEAAASAIRSRGVFTVALSGGSTPKAAYQLLAADPFAQQVDWPHVQLFCGDERCVPPTHADSNYRMAKETLLDHVPIPESHIHRMQGENPDVDSAAAHYAQELNEVFTVGQGALPRFDLVDLGMGDDGHTLSLFPGTQALQEREKWVTANWVEKFHTNRITLTAPVVNNAALVAFLAPGAGKASRLKEVIEGPKETTRLPSQLIQPEVGRLLWIIDKAAAADLSQK
jgi:6-phosphogluconolactonase